MPPRPSALTSRLAAPPLTSRGGCVRSEPMLCCVAPSGEVRRRVVDGLARLGLPHDLVEDAALLLSEMVSNAVRFADPLPGDVLLVRACGQVRLLLRVTDGGVADPAGPGPPGRCVRGRAAEL